MRVYVNMAQHLQRCATKPAKLQEDIVTAIGYPALRHWLLGEMCENEPFISADVGAIVHTDSRNT